MKLDSIRREYKKAALSKKSIHTNPFEQFSKWMNEALNSGTEDTTSVALVTNGLDGFPQSRIVLLKDYNSEGFVIYTNYKSSKGREIEKDKRVGLHFFWSELERQIRISGFAVKTSFSQSENYFHSRPIDSQLAAVISEQSTEIPSREFLENKFDALKNQLKGEMPDCPENWGGYLIKPVKFEFWQGRENRLHDRISYEKQNDNWKIKRLAP